MLLACCIVLLTRRLILCANRETAMPCWKQKLVGPNEDVGVAARYMYKSVEVAISS